MNLKGKLSFGRNEVMTLFLSIFSTYILWSYLVTGLFMGNFRTEQPLYVMNLLLFWILTRKAESPFQNAPVQGLLPKDRWSLYFVAMIAFILLLPLLSQMIHGGLPNAHLRFPIQP